VGSRCPRFCLSRRAPAHLYQPFGASLCQSPFGVAASILLRWSLPPKSLDIPSQAPSRGRTELPWRHTLPLHRLGHGRRNRARSEVEHGACPACSRFHLSDSQIPKIRVSYSTGYTEGRTSWPDKRKTTSDSTRHINSLQAPRRVLR
jgi:hypothetical protein